MVEYRIIREVKIGGHPWSELEAMIIEPDFDFDAFVVSFVHLITSFCSDHSLRQTK